MVFRNLRGVIGCLLLLSLVACGVETPSPTPTPVEETNVTVPSVRFVAPPAQLCREATQLRLQPLVEGEWPLGQTARWILRRSEAASSLAEGTWSPAERDLFVAFPEGEALAPGAYQLVLEMADSQMGTHDFTVLEQAPALVTTTLALTPEGPSVDIFDGPLPVFYVGYGYEGVCPGTPLWIRVLQGTDSLVNRKVTLETVEGAGAVPCFQEGGTLFDVGTYSVTLTLGGAPVASFPFEIASAETPPRRYTPTCETPFTAAGLSPEGEPFLSQESFQWYTQGVYVGAPCRDLPPSAPWKAAWYRAGELVAVNSGQRVGEPRGIVWDSLTGTEENPFLVPGNYTVTLTISETISLGTAFRVVPYVPPEAESGD